MKKKILFLTNHLQFSDGVAKSLVNLVNCLDANEYEITIEVLFRCDEKFITQINNNVKIIRVFNGYFRGLSKIIRMLPQKLMYSLLIKENYDIEVAYQTGLPTKLLSYEGNPEIKRIAWVHSYSIEEDKDLFCKYDCVNCVSNHAKSEWEKVGVSTVFFVNYSIVNYDEIITMAQEELESKPGVFNLLFVGRISPEKDIIKSIILAEFLIKNGINAKLTIVGGFSKKKKNYYCELTDYVHTHNLDNIVKFVGAQNNPYKYMKNADLLLLTSTAEGYGLVLEESLAVGTPFCSFDIGGAQELADLTNAGIVVQNIENMQRCVLDLINFKNYDVLKEKAMDCLTKLNSFNRKEKIEKELF